MDYIIVFILGGVAQWAFVKFLLPKIKKWAED